MSDNEYNNFVIENEKELLKQFVYESKELTEDFEKFCIYCLNNQKFKGGKWKN